MGTYATTDPAGELAPLCDECSTFEPDGFAAHGRSWAPVVGAPCDRCGKDC